MRATAIFVLSYRIDFGTPPKKVNAFTCASQKASVVSAGSHHEAGVRVRQVEREEVNLALYAADHGQRLAEVRLRVSRSDA